MKQAKGIGGKSGADNEDDLQVVPVESTSEYEKQLFQVFSWWSLLKVVEHKTQENEWIVLWLCSDFYNFSL